MVYRKKSSVWYAQRRSAFSVLASCVYIYIYVCVCACVHGCVCEFIVAQQVHGSRLLELYTALCCTYGKQKSCPLSAKERIPCFLVWFHSAKAVGP